MNIKILYIGFLLTSLLLLAGCLNFVEDGIEVDYADSDATLNVGAIGSTFAAENETVSFEINVSSAFDIKSCIIKTTVEGKNGSGFNVSDENYDDPFADHNFGTIRPGIKSFKVRYDYILPEDLSRSRITFTIIDESGKVEVEELVSAVPSVSLFKNIVSYAKDATFHDGIAASEGVVYEDMKSNYSSFTEQNLDVQEKVDIIFYYDKGSNNAVITSPASGRIDQELSVENNTSFKKLDLGTDFDIEAIGASELAQITDDANLQEEGRSQVDRIKVGDVIAFVADVNALNSLDKGLLKIKGLHPGSVPRYDGISYVMTCDIIVQK